MNTLQLRSGQTSQPFPVGIGSIVSLTPASIGGGTGYIEYTLNTQTDINNNLATWVRWPKGSVSVTTSDVGMFNILARAVCTAGNITVVGNDPTNSTVLNTIPWASNQASYTYDSLGNFIGFNVTGANPSGFAAVLWANRPTASASTGAIIRVTDVGGNVGTGGGNYFFSNGVRWKPVNGCIVLDSIDTPNTSVANTTEQNLNPNHIIIPAGVIGDFDRLRLRVTMSKSGAADTSTIRFRFGPLGTVADPILATISSLATTNISLGVLLDFKRASSTTVQKLGSASTDQAYNGASAGAYPAVTTVSDMNANGMYLSITSQMTGGTETVTVQDYTFELCPTDSL